ncbi:MAG TPA: hypothetical protein DDY78_26685 [Planctomycetales bacterium]|jgi:hypothetical protein|nr:hypothetical protein [Planctomycetales bacterium]
MRISKQVSGNAARRDVDARQGRGEYEWCGLTEYDPTHDELLNRRVFLTLPGAIRLDTRCVLGWDEETQKKNRIRNDDDATGVRHNYPPYHLAAALMLPLQTRKEQNWGEGRPILRTEEYSILHIFCGQITLADDSRGRGGGGGTSTSEYEASE